MRYFNTAGPVNCKEHYCVPPIERFNLDELLMLIHQKKYFVLHAPRQTGKTSCLMALMEYLNPEDQYTCLYINVEVGQSARENVKRGIRAILNELGSRARIYLQFSYLNEIWPDVLEKSGEDGALNEVLSLWAENNPKPVVLLIDEIDSLVGDTLISVLRQLRAGYDKRPRYFPQSIILCGVRDVRDYRIHSDREKMQITGGSAFNIKAKSLRLGDFSQNEVAFLLNEHTRETGQMFHPASLELIWELSQGQPWVVNALAYEACFEIDEGKNRNNPITPDRIHQAKENLISRRETHLDQLADKLKDPRVRSVIEPLMTGTSEPQIIAEDDLQYVMDLGFIRRKPQVEITNPIYREIIPRMLTESVQDMLPFKTLWYVTEQGTLDMPKLMAEFQQFFREHSESWMERFDYKEAGPQLLLQAFLQRIINAGGRVEREYGLGRKRTDLLIHWKHDIGVQRIVVELKIKYGSLETTIEEGLEQASRYMDQCGADEGHVVIFDRSPDKTWDDKIFHEEKTVQGKTIWVWGM